MKSSCMILAVGAFVASAVAQDTLPECGQSCIASIMAKASTFNGACAADDAACLCKDINFTYAIRDCTLQACGGEVSSAAVAFGDGYCKNAGVVVPGSGSGSDSSTDGGDSAATSTNAGGALGSAITTSAIESLITDGSSVITSIIGSTTIFAGAAGAISSVASEGSAALTTSAIESLVTDGSSVFTSIIGSTTIFGAAGSAVGSGASSIASGISSAASNATSNASGALSTASGALSSIESSASGAISTAASGLSTVLSSVRDAATSAANAATSTTSGNGVNAMQTAAPVFMAAAGLAALLL